MDNIDLKFQQIFLNSLQVVPKGTSLETTKKQTLVNLQNAFTSFLLIYQEPVQGPSRALAQLQEYS